MPSTTPVMEAANVVVPGSFNPGLFHPLWFSNQGLIPQIEAEAAKNLVTTNDYSRFETDWLTIEVISERLTLTTQQAPYFHPIRDLAESILNLLPHTPVIAIGLNRSAHFQIDDNEKWHSFGHRLAPKPVWEKILREPGTLRLVVQGQRDDGRPGAVNVTVGPSDHLERGFFIDFNDHFSRPAEIEATSGSGWATDVISKCWTQHQDRVEVVRATLLQFASEGGS